MNPTSYWNRRHRWLLAVVLLGGAMLRFVDLSGESYWIDEVSMLNVAGSVQAAAADVRDNGRPPVYVALAVGWIRIFGDSEGATRALSATAGTAAIPMMYVVGRQLLGPWVGLGSALLLAVSQLQLVHARDFRYYSLVVLLTLVSFHFYWQAMQSNRRRHLAGWTIASLLLFYTHYLAVFALTAQTAHLLLSGRIGVRRWIAARDAPWLLAQAVVYAAPVVQLAPPLAARAMQGAPMPGPIWLPPVTTFAVAQTVRDYLFAGVPVRLLALGVAVAAAAWCAWWIWSGSGAFRIAVRRDAQDLSELLSRRSEWLLIACWLLLPIVLPILLSLTVRPMFMGRYTIGASPAFYLAAAAALHGLRHLFPPVPVLSLFLALITPGLVRFYTVPYKEQWREAAAYVESAAHERDALVVFPHSHREAWDWYYRNAAAECEVDEPAQGSAAVAGTIERCAAARRRVWLVARTPDLAPDFDETLAGLPVAVRRYDLEGIRLYAVTARGTRALPASATPAQAAP